jgi:hypothetical protein
MESTLFDIKVFPQSNFVLYIRQYPPVFVRRTRRFVLRHELDGISVPSLSRAWNGQEKSGRMSPRAFVANSNTMGHPPSPSSLKFRGWHTLVPTGGNRNSPARLPHHSTRPRGNTPTAKNMDEPASVNLITLHVGQTT